MDFRPFLSDTLQEAGNVAKEKFGRVSMIETKPGDNNQVLTEADVAIGRSIVGKIEKRFPDHNIIDEEAGVIDKGSDWSWVVDPIDGTSNFANGLRMYGVMVGLLHETRAVLGGIFLPSFDELYLAQKGLGAFCNDEPIRVTSETNLRAALVAYGIDGHPEDVERTRSETALLAEIILSIRNIRTTNSAFDMAQVPAGRYGAYLNQTTKIWDNAALQPLVEEAGGVVTDIRGKPMDYSHPLTRMQHNYTICAASPALHKQLMGIIDRFYEGK